MRLVGKSPEGEWQARITCTKTMEACYQRADVVCKHGYDVVSENGQASNTGAVTHCDPNLGNCYTRTTQDFDGVLFVSCKHQGNAVPKMAAH